MILDTIWGSNMALLVVDMQRKFAMERADWAVIRDSAVGKINSLTEMFRSHGRSVIFVATDGEGHGLYTGDDGDEWLEGLRCLPDDIVVHKGGMSAFRGTNLEDILKEEGIDCVLIAGMYTEMCVVGTYFSASERDIFPCLAQDAVIAYGEGINDAAEKILNIVSADTVERFLDGEQEYLDPGAC
ncbi:MAG: cysteine hydrolase [archaeon]|nr:cysteine hydrolase [archaeon]